MSNNISSIIGPKVAVLGLSNAGKTSIILSLLKQFDSIANIKPTHGVKRETLIFLGKTLHFWDFGGQDLYRDRYLNQPEIYFNEISFVFYVIDIQDEFLLDVNISYFKILLKHVREFSPNAKWIIIYHKADPDFNIFTKVVNVKQEFEKAIIPLLSKENIEYTSYNTTIFDPHTIIKAFSEPFIQKLGVCETISNILNEFCSTYSISYAALFTTNHFELGFYSKDDKINKIIKEYLNAITATSKSIDKKKIKGLESERKENEVIEPANGILDLLNISYEEYQVISIEFGIGYHGIRLPFYLLVGYEEHKIPFSKDRFEGIIENLAKNLKILLQNIDLEQLF